MILQREVFKEQIRPPLGLIAELTHRCPLKCTYCSNPLTLANLNQELPGRAWLKVIDQAAKYGVQHISFTGGEPMHYPELDSLVARAATQGLYTNLITSGTLGSEAGLKRLVELGLDHVQLSLQDTTSEGLLRVTGADVLRRKKEFASWVAQLPVAFTVNLVIHRENILRLPELLEWAKGAQAQKVEVAHVQFLGRASRNRRELEPTADQVLKADAVVAEFRAQVGSSIKVDYVYSLQQSRLPKPCMGGWGEVLMLIDPTGRAMPCHSAQVLPEAHFENIQDVALEKIWTDGEIFNRYRRSSCGGSAEKQAVACPCLNLG